MYLSIKLCDIYTNRIYIYQNIYECILIYKFCSFIYHIILYIKIYTYKKFCSLILLTQKKFLKKFFILKNFLKKFFIFCNSVMKD